MQTKKVVLIFCVFMCVIMGALLWSMLPRIFGKSYILHLSSVNVAKLPFGSYVLATPSIDNLQDPSQLPCKNLYAKLESNGDYFNLSGNLSCTPPKDSPYLKGSKSSYGITFNLGNLWVTSQEEKWLLDSQEEGNLMAKVCIYEGRANLQTLVY